MGTCLSTILGVWLMVFLYAAIHDQFIMRIHHEHFTVWHYQIPFTRNLSLLALLYAFGGSISPGLSLGMVLYVVAGFSIFRRNLDRGFFFESES